MYYIQTIKEFDKQGIGSLGIVLIISVFMGAVVTLQTAINLENPLIPRYMIGLAARDSMILEFSSTIIGLILAGKAGSNVASEIGTMRITEQIDALEIMGVNSASYLVMPKIIAMVLIMPAMVIISIFIGVSGGAIAGSSAGAISLSDYVYGIQFDFKPFYITYSVTKAVIFAFVIMSVSGYHGYKVKGGALEVGKASTKSVVYSSILILIFNLLITQLFLT
jgi:phospholipid/cholesterol/gamma-HCH transport system permease protein